MTERETKVLVVGLVIKDIKTAMWPGLEAVLDADERRHAAKFAFEADRRAYIAAHALLRYTMSEKTGVNPAVWRFAAGAYGKPFLEEPRCGLDLRFSLSHAGSMVAIAMAQGIEVGVDVEPAERAARLDLEIADVFFTPDEAAWLRAPPETQQQRDRFLALWTLKEAVIKATGHGLSQSLNSFGIGFDPLRLTLCNMPEAASEPGRWSLAHWRLRDHDVAAAAHAHTGRSSFEYREARCRNFLM